MENLFLKHNGKSNGFYDANYNQKLRFPYFSFDTSLGRTLVSLAYLFFFGLRFWDINEEFYKMNLQRILPNIRKID